MTDKTKLSDAEIRDIADDFKSEYHHGGTTFDTFDSMGFARALETRIAASRATDAPAPQDPTSEQNARYAIETAIGWGRNGTNKPPADGHWLMPYWKIGQYLGPAADGWECLAVPDVPATSEPQKPLEPAPALALGVACCDAPAQGEQGDAVAAEMKRLHDALCFWLPQSHAGLPDAMQERVAADAYLLVGYDDMPDPKTAEELGWIAAAPSEQKPVGYVPSSTVTNLLAGADTEVTVIEREPEGTFVVPLFAGPVASPVASEPKLAPGTRDDFNLMFNCRAMLKGSSFQGVRNWAIAEQLFAVGSKSARQICIDVGIDPDSTTVGRAALAKKEGR